MMGTLTDPRRLLRVHGQWLTGLRVEHKREATMTNQFHDRLALRLVHTAGQQRMQRNVVNDKRLGELQP